MTKSQHRTRSSADVRMFRSWRLLGRVQCLSGSCWELRNGNWGDLLFSNILLDLALRPVGLCDKWPQRRSRLWDERVTRGTLTGKWSVDRRFNRTEDTWCLLKKHWGLWKKESCSSKAALLIMAGGHFPKEKNQSYKPRGRQYNGELGQGWRTVKGKKQSKLESTLWTLHLAFPINSQHPKVLWPVEPARLYLACPWPYPTCAQLHTLGGQGAPIQRKSAWLKTVWSPRTWVWAFWLQPLWNEAIS